MKSRQEWQSSTMKSWILSQYLKNPMNNCFIVLCQMKPNHFIALIITSSHPSFSLLPMIKMQKFDCDMLCWIWFSEQCKWVPKKIKTWGIFPRYHVNESIKKLQVIKKMKNAIFYHYGKIYHSPSLKFLAHIPIIDWFINQNSRNKSLYVYDRINA